MSQTPNHGYNVPQEGATNWHRPLNDNFRQYDVDIEVRDADANRGNYEPGQGAKFLATDTGIIYEGDGTDWVPSLAVPRTSTASNGDAADSLVAGHSTNSVGNSVSGATIAGGGRGGNFALPNEVTADFGTVGGGRDNRVTGRIGTVGGGDGNEASGASATVAGGWDNGAKGANATVGGGNKNRAFADYSTVAGGLGNAASGPRAAVGGGFHNEVRGEYGTIAGGGPTEPGKNPQTTRNVVRDAYGTVGGGGNNEVAAGWGTVGGGEENTAGSGGQGGHATVGGGRRNEASGEYTAVPGGRDNTASGDYAFAAGRGATAEGDGTFVWGDSSQMDVTATQEDEFKVQAGGGAVIFSASDHSTGVNLAPGSGSWSAWCSRTAKENVEPVDPEAALAGVRDLDVSTWNYESQDESVRHMSPMAEEFHDEFGLGDDRERIANVDADGVALAAIQGLAERVDERDDRIERLESENEDLRDRLAALEERVEPTDGSDRLDDGRDRTGGDGHAW